MTTLSPDTVRRIEDAAAALIAAGTPNPKNPSSELNPRWLQATGTSQKKPTPRKFGTDTHAYCAGPEGRRITVLRLCCAEIWPAVMPPFSFSGQIQVTVREV